MENRPVYVLDTNVLVHDPESIFKFSNGIVILPYPVLAELDKFKKENTERGYSARESIRLLDNLRIRGSLSNGINLDNGGFFKILLMTDQIIKNHTIIDDIIIESAIFLKNKGDNVILISKDFALRIKADSLGLLVEDYQQNKISKDNFYHGWKEFSVASSDLKFNMNQLLLEAKAQYSFTLNEFALFKSYNQEHVFRIFRYIGNNKFIEASLPSKILWGIEPKNPHQAMVIDLLLDDQIKLVILFGPSGTGKTFLVLATMLYKVLCTRIYEKLLISRPLVPLGNDIGYLPGDLQEKLQTWMQPIKDNMDFLLYQMNKNEFSSGSYHEENSPILKNNLNKKKHFQKENFVKKTFPKVTSEDLLSENGKISLEAITYMRGRSIPHQAIFIDEVQNLTSHEVKTLISRAGEGSKIILAGDPYQIDSPYLDFASNGLVIASEKFKGQSIFGTVYLNISERSILSSLANQLM